MSVVLYDLVHDAKTVLCDVMLLYLEISTQGYMQFTTVYRIFSESLLKNLVTIYLSACNFAVMCIHRESLMSDHVLLNLLDQLGKSDKMQGLPRVLRVCNENLIFLFLNQNICCGYSKEPSQWDGSFEHPKHMLNWWVRKYL